MSSSKYYHTTESFQEEKIVEGNMRQEGWKPLPVKTSPAFVPQSTQIPRLDPMQKVSPTRMVPSSSQNKIFDTTSPEKEALEEETTPEAKEPVPEPEPEPEPPQPEIDLSQYMEINEAQAQIEAAYKEGVQTGINQAEEDYGSAIKALVNICNQLNILQETIIRNSSDEFLDFALAIAERIIRFSVSQQDETIVATVKEALQRAIRSEEFTIYLHPEDMETIQAKSADIVAEISGLDNIVLKNDSAIERGGARLESDNCTIDATIASQFATIRDNIVNKP